MLNKSFLIITLINLLGISASKAQFTEKHNLNFRNASYDIFVIKVDSAVINKFTIVNNNTSLSEPDFFEYLSKSLNQPFFAITASIVDTACNPLGLYISESNKLNNINLSQGNGNFYLKPNGVIWIDTTYHVNVQDAASFKDNTPYKFAIQSGPMLIRDGVINTSFDKNSKNKNIRCGVGIFTEKNERFLIFIKSIIPVTFYQFSQLFQEKYKCANALNLEGSGNCSIHFPTYKLVYNSKVRICRYLLIAL